MNNWELPSIRCCVPGDSMSDPGRAATPNTSRGVPTVMGPDRSAVNTAFSTPTPSHDQLQLSAIASTEPYVPAQQLNDTTQDHVPSKALFALPVPARGTNCPSAVMLASAKS